VRDKAITEHFICRKTPGNNFAVVVYFVRLNTKVNRISHMRESGNDNLKNVLSLLYVRRAEWD
jgi:hypothetical protein